MSNAIEVRQESKNLVTFQRGLRGALARGVVDRIELRHLHDVGGESVAMTLSGEALQAEIKAAGNNEAAARVLAEQLLEHAEEESKSLKGVNRYAIAIYRPGDSNYCDRKIITIRGTAIEDSDTIEETEPPNATGLVSQMMRHTEVMAKTSAMDHERQLRYYDAMLTRMGSTIEHLTTKHIQVLELTEAILDGKAQRDLDIRRQEKGDQLKQRLMEQLLMTAAPLLSKLTSGKPELNAAATDNLLVTLVASLKPQQIEGFVQTLAPEQQALFFELYQTIVKRNQAVNLDPPKEGGDGQG